MQQRRIKKMPKLNLIPILDAIFIFIFFLLMSAQFLDIYEIGSDAPIVSRIETPPPEKEPLNLVLEIKKKSILIKIGLDGKLYKSINIKKLSDLNNSLIELKKKYPKEESAILRPYGNYKYQNIVKVIDATREVLKDDVYVPNVDEKNRKQASKKLFNKIIFETIE